MAVIVNVGEAKTHLSKLLEQAREGEEVIVAKAGNPVARLVPIEPARAPRQPGTGKGLFEMRDDFDDPLPDDVAEAFGIF